MGVRRVGTALKKARGRLSQKAAADRWGVPVATLAALEQGIERDYQSQTLAQFDEMLGQSTLDLYNEADEDAGGEIRQLREDVNAQLDQLQRRMDEFVALGRRRPGDDEELAVEIAYLSDPERRALAAFLRLRRQR